MTKPVADGGAPDAADDELTADEEDDAGLLDALELALAELVLDGELDAVAPGIHCEYQSLDLVQVLPDWQQVGPV